ncbi:hypothetical protein KY290_024837 [Solanum tuberosum]|uniref:Uncharacterized protein n=1 Tax=Solanum tuberosum TaxID=4113 RepID=A0ABQ7UTU2_SOLTU|nr:hypothetical protein KY284_023691 [Solanum tuberosum]KAH0754567.1 hypothetical protein KY290_024837 [Solanum tuberosum]
MRLLYSLVETQFQVLCQFPGRAWFYQAYALRYIVHHDGIPKFNSFGTSEEDVVYVPTVVASYLTTRVDIQANSIKVVGARDFLVVHELDEGFDFVGTSHVPDPIKILNPLIW